MNLGWPVLLKLRMIEVVVTTGDIRRAEILSNRHHQQNNTQDNIQNITIHLKH